MRARQNQSARGIIAALMVIAVAIFALGAGAEGKRAIYKDTKNGYFMFVPPDGWRAEVAPDTRTKVSFVNPTDAGVFLRFITREAPGEDFARMKKEDEATARSMRDRGITCTVTETDFMGVNSTEISAEFPNGQGFTRLRKFIAVGLHFNIQYSAPSKTLYDKHLKEAMDSLDTIVLAKDHKPDTEKAQNQEIAHYLRFAQLTDENVSTEEALAILRQGAQKYPHSKEIQDALSQMDKKATKTEGKYVIEQGSPGGK